MSSKNEVEKQLAFEELEKSLDDLIKAAEHSELYGYDLNALNDDDGKIIKERLLRKFLQANGYEIGAAKQQFLKTLKWRKTFKPLDAAYKETHSEILDKVGVVTKQVVTEKENQTLVTTWNLYGAVADRQLIFGDLDKFLRWRVALMEKGISLLDFTKEDESCMSQVHDYFNVSFLRLDSSTKAASKAAIDLFQNYYPEFLGSKYFVNVPTFMQWMFAFVRPFLSKETVAKFHVIADGSNLASQLGQWVPKNYGGKAESLSAIKVSEFGPTRHLGLLRSDVDQKESWPTEAATIPKNP